jgi:DNA methylase
MVTASCGYRCTGCRQALAASRAPHRADRPRVLFGEKGRDGRSTIDSAARDPGGGQCDLGAAQQRGEQLDLIARHALQQRLHAGQDAAGETNEPVFEMLVERFTPAGGLVADPFAGSGTNAADGARLERKGWGCDGKPVGPAGGRRVTSWGRI